MALTVHVGKPLDVRPLVDRFDPGNRVVARFVPQEADYWCWAACMESVLGSHGKCGLRQRKIVKRVRDHLGKKGCSDADLKLKDPPKPCDFSLATSDVEKVWCLFWFPDAEFARDNAGNGRHLTEAEIVLEIAAGRQVQAFGAEHYVLIYGWRRNPDGTLMVQVMDPAKSTLDASGVAPAGIFQERGGQWTGSTFRLAYDSTHDPGQC